MADRDRYESGALEVGCLSPTCHGQLCQHMTERIARFARDSAAAARKEAFEEAAKEVPSNWLDPLLTGPGTDHWEDCRKVERLLGGVRKRIAARAAEAKP